MIGFFRIDTLTLLVLVALCGCNQPNLRGAPADVALAEKLRLEAAEAASGAGDGGSQAAQPKRTGWATLRGTIRVVGDPPKPGILTITKDQQVCAPGGETVLSPAIVVDPATGGLANLALYALDLSGDNVHPDAQAGKTDEVIFDQKNCMFLSHVLPLQATQTLKILNSDSIPHNTKIDGKASKFENVNLVPRGSAMYVPGRQEKSPIPVSCSIHPWMSAYLLPRDNSYAVVTGPDGSFELANLPAGVDLSIQAWHEMIDSFNDITVNGKKTSWKRGRMALDGPLAPDEVRELKIEIPATAL